MKPTLYFSWVSSNKVEDQNIPMTIIEGHSDEYYFALCQWWSDGENGEWRTLPHAPVPPKPSKDKNGKWQIIHQVSMPPNPEDYKPIKK